MINNHINLRSDTDLTEISLFEQEALLCHFHLSPESIPAGFYSYEVADMDDCDCMDLLAERLPPHLQFVGTILTRTPVVLDENGFRDVSFGNCYYTEDDQGNGFFHTIESFMELYYPNEAISFPTIREHVSAPNPHNAVSPPASLPKCCYSTDKNGRIVLIDYGKKGHRPYPFTGTGQLDTALDNQVVAAHLNTALGITIQQERAMVCGSAFGWNTPGASPTYYDERGNPHTKEHNARKKIDHDHPGR